MNAPIRVEAGRRLPVALRDGFDYITDPAVERATRETLVDLERRFRERLAPVARRRSKVAPWLPSPLAASRSVRPS